MLHVLCQRRGAPIDENDFASLKKLVPDWLTPGAAETLAVKTLRSVLTEKRTPQQALSRNLTDYQPPVSRDVMEAQIRLAVNEASDWDFVPQAVSCLSEKLGSVFFTHVVNVALAVKFPAMR